MKAVVRLRRARLAINRFVICGCHATAVFVLSRRVRLRDDDHEDDEKLKKKERKRKKLKKESAAPCCILWGENAAISNVVFIKTTQDYMYLYIVCYILEWYLLSLYI